MRYGAAIGLRLQNIIDVVHLRKRNQIKKIKMKTKSKSGRNNYGSRSEIRDRFSHCSSVGPGLTVRKEAAVEASERVLQNSFADVSENINLYGNLISPLEA